MRPTEEDLRALARVTAGSWVGDGLRVGVSFV